MSWIQKIWSCGARDQDQEIGFVRFWLHFWSWICWILTEILKLDLLDFDWIIEVGFVGFWLNYWSWILTELLKLDLLDFDCIIEVGFVGFWLNYWSWICWILTELLKLDLLDFDWIIEVGFVGWSNWENQWDWESIPINLLGRTCLFYTHKPDDEEDPDHFSNLEKHLLCKKVFLNMRCNMKYLWPCSYTFLFVTIFLKRCSLY